MGLRPGGVDDASALRRDIVAHWPDYLAALPPPTRSDLREVMATARPGVYRIRRAPPLPEFDDLVRGFPGEVGLMKLFGDWYVSYNLEEATRWGRRSSRAPLASFDELIAWVDGAGVADLDLHSHPTDDDLAMIPSIDDALALKNTRDGVAYIWTPRGLLEFRRPAQLPGGRESPKQAWSYWVREQLAQADVRGVERGVMELRRDFYRSVYRLRLLDLVEAAAVFDRAAAPGCEGSLSSVSTGVGLVLKKGGATVVNALSRFRATLW